MENHFHPINPVHNNNEDFSCHRNGVNKISSASSTSSTTSSTASSYGDSYSENRIEKSRERNREHAKKTRLRKKVLIEGMTGKLLALQKEVGIDQICME